MANNEQKTPMAQKSANALACPSSDTAHAFAPLPFDESFMTSTRTSETVNSSTIVTSTKSAADFFLDQIAAVMSDEKKLSDNIMDLIPPVEAPMSQAAVTQAMTSSSVSIGMPLQPPPDLMRALSPPTSLLPDFGDLASLALLGDAITSNAATIPTTTTALKRDLSMMKHGTNVALPRKVETVSQSLKKPKNETSGVENESHAAMHVPLSTRHSSYSPPASGAATAREKGMKEPQSGDLYECVITKRNGGLGLTLACVDDHVQITGLAPDTPAANSGICVGDTLVAVSGLPVRGLQFSTVIGRLKSTSRNSVVLKLRRNPFRQNAGNSAVFRGTKRPVRGVMKTSESSNSANVLSHKTTALESRLGGNGLNASAGKSLHNGTPSVDTEDLHRVHYPTGSGRALSLRADPMNSTYFPTDASILTLGATTVASSNFTSSSSSFGDLQSCWRANEEEKERYYAECRALRHELGRAVAAQRIQKRLAEKYTQQLQNVVDKFQVQIQEFVSSSRSDDVVKLRQQLVEAHQALAKQQTEMLVLQEAETRHARPDAQRIKRQLVSLMRNSVFEMDCKAFVAAADGSVAPRTSWSFEERLDGVRPSAFAFLTGQKNLDVSAWTQEQTLDIKSCSEVRLNLFHNVDEHVVTCLLRLLGWNMREVVVQAGASYSVSVTDPVHFKLMKSEDLLVVSWTLRVKDCSKSRTSTSSSRNST
ncbi:hypothetical protein CCR75_004796 [Bremia lactucae]|uniref:PDZ domain-containing protein n=1 Tax=Bremia lactucae TaxID=4779 RepID=A0A976IC53_BRELC|nr:hypothetical protein CCR75_004796 [Bremia lactucae]